MAVGFGRTATPQITYETSIGAWECFRVHNRTVDKLDGLMMTGELREFFLKLMIPHHVGSAVRGIELPQNEGKRDIFVLIEAQHIPLLRQGFELHGFAPDLAA